MRISLSGTGVCLGKRMTQAQRVYKMPFIGEVTVSNTFIVFACLAMLAQAIFIIVALFCTSPKNKNTTPGSD